MAKFETQLFNKNVNAKYQKASVKALVQGDLSVYALSKQKQNKQTGKNG